MGCCQDRINVTLKANEVKPLAKAPIIFHPHKGQSMEPMKISIIGDMDKMDIFDDFPSAMPSITQIDQKTTSKLILSREFKETKELKSTSISETVIIDLRSASCLQSPLKPITERRSSKNLNQKFIGML
ncbi:unnamed protein product (macronuclear) [Paramecium tetraurelia]|uniref:Uncharacterized protein n=1 Tax=Paramecium tetraurelia TaxID=5888 RepID=A0EG88_PARTE|nr:uncharacterized protein GSPATT00026653001 [Paramecium tetraurelia]CAK94329.1 unnamed protein product [Paramecium tetraurelia]|eukprot:XP_001461702.1 hypothetical protein (macronuclear) [Paramecium tetraurelia strain d4-2]